MYWLLTQLKKSQLKLVTDGLLKMMMEYVLALMWYDSFLHDVGLGSAEGVRRTV